MRLKFRGRMADGVINPMRVDTSLLQGISAANGAAKATSASLKSTGTSTSFSSQLKSATEKETTKPVPGKGYAEILTGPRAGLYLNTSGGARDGQAFVLVKRDGREDRIYGTGDDRTVVTVKTDGSESSSSSTEKAPEGERTEQVAGRAYHDILNGKRSGLYLNTSGNARDGQTFVLVKRDGREYHIYGSGKDRQIFSMVDPTSKKTEDSSSSTNTSTTDTSAPTGNTPTGTLVTENPS
jgi:hypothetical protein